MSERTVAQGTHLVTSDAVRRTAHSLFDGCYVRSISISFWTSCR